jgi:hypothetical protein
VELLPSLLPQARVNNAPPLPLHYWSQPSLVVISTTVHVDLHHKDEVPGWTLQSPRSMCNVFAPRNITYCSHPLYLQNISMLHLNVGGITTKTRSDAENNRKKCICRPRLVDANEANLTSSSPRDEKPVLT